MLAFLLNNHDWKIVGWAAMGVMVTGTLWLLFFSDGVPWTERGRRRQEAKKHTVRITGAWPEATIWLKGVENKYDPELDTGEREYTADFYPGTRYAYYPGMDYPGITGAWGYRDLKGRFIRATLHDPFSFPELVYKYGRPGKV